MNPLTPTRPDAAAPAASTSSGSRELERVEHVERPLAHARSYEGAGATESTLVVLGPLARLVGRVLIFLIRLYQLTLSPVLPVLTLGRCGCRFSPTCSHYAADAIRIHGAATGVWLAIVRLVKCTPLHPGGFDPVPPHRAAVPRCTRSRSGLFASRL